MNEHNQERWLPVVNLEGLYEVSDLGRIRSVERLYRTGVALCRLRGRVLTARRKRGGSPLVTVSLAQALAPCWAGRTRTPLSVARCVLEAFIGQPPSKSRVRFKNGDRSDCRLVNLEWHPEEGEE